MLKNLQKNIQYLYLCSIKNKKRTSIFVYDSFCEVLKLAAKPSCLGGGEPEIKCARAFPNYPVKVRILPLQPPYMIVIRGFSR